TPRWIFRTSLPRSYRHLSLSSSVLKGEIERLLGETDPDKLLLDVERELCQRSLAEFQRRAWHVVEPATKRLDNWHIDAICDHLEAVTRGEIQNLVINIPPRCEKSLNVAVFWPAWVWTFWPESRWSFFSYEQKLSTRDSLKCRRVIQSSWYQRLWGHKFELTSDQNVKLRFENDRTGFRMASSIAGMGTGEGGDFIVADDPHKVKEAESELIREGVLEWWDQTMSTRADVPTRVRRVIVMQRVHERDLAGHVLETGRWEHLCIPMEYDGERSRTVLDFKDPRNSEGELLWPERFPAEALAPIKEELGPYGTAGQLQQRPSPRRGGMFDRESFVSIDYRAIAPGQIYIRAWDKAGTAGGGAWTAGVLLGFNPATGRYVVRDVVRGRWAFEERERVIRRTATQDEQNLGGKFAFTVWLEQEPGSGGKDSAAITLQMLSRLGYRAFAEPMSGKGTKFYRADPFSGAVKAGLVDIVEAPWTEAFLREAEHYGPGASEMDQIDAASMAYNKLALGIVVEDTDEIMEGFWVG
ncbi:MAG: phage terminase large subunit, partial [Candidatus Methylomirabilales bacterium]